MNVMQDVQERRVAGLETQMRHCGWQKQFQEGCCLKKKQKTKLIKTAARRLVYQVLCACFQILRIQHGHFHPFKVLHIARGVVDSHTNFCGANDEPTWQPLCRQRRSTHRAASARLQPEAIKPGPSARSPTPTWRRVGSPECKTVPSF